MTSATVIKNADGQWVVMQKSELVAGPFDTMAQGWRWIDRQSGSPLNRGEDVANWAFNQDASR